MVKSKAKEKFEKLMETKTPEITVSESELELKNKIDTTAIGAIKIKNKTYLLMVGEDKKWYKKEEIGYTRHDEMNNTPLVSIWGEITPLTESEFKQFMKK